MLLCLNPKVSLVQRNVDEMSLYTRVNCIIFKVSPIVFVYLFCLHYTADF